MLRARRLMAIGMLVLSIVILYQATAFALAVSPAEIKIKRLMRGATINKAVQITNTDKKNVTLKITVENKPINNWITICDPKTDKSIRSIDIRRKKSATLSVIIKVPKNTPNGKYKALLLLTPDISKSNNVKDTNSMFIAVPVIPINIEVTDKQHIDANISNFSIMDTEYGDPLLIEVSMENNSNVALTPSLIMSIQKDGYTLQRSVLEMDTIDIGADTAQNFTLSLNKNKIGNYKAVGTVEFQNVESKKMYANFRIVKPGTFSKALMQSFEVKGEKQPGKTVKLIGIFASKSPRVLKAKLVVDVYSNGLKIGSTESKFLSVSSWSQQKFEAPFAIPEAGKYRIDGYFAFKNKESNHRQLLLNVMGTQWPLVGGISMVVLMLAGVLIMFYKKNSRGKRVAGMA